MFINMCLPVIFNVSTRNKQNNLMFIHICMFHNMFHGYFQLSCDKELFLSLYVLLV